MGIVLIRIQGGMRAKPPLTNSTNFLIPYSLLIISNPIQYSVYINSHHLYIHLNEHSYMHIVCIFNNYVFNMYYTLYNCHFTCYKTVNCQSKISIYQKIENLLTSILMKTSIYSKMIAILKHFIFQNLH